MDGVRIGRRRAAGAAGVAALAGAVLAGAITLVVTRRRERSAADPHTAVPVAALLAHGFVAGAAILAVLTAFT